MTKSRPQCAVQGDGRTFARELFGVQRFTLEQMPAGGVLLAAIARCPSPASRGACPRGKAAIRSRGDKPRGSQVVDSSTEPSLHLSGIVG
jgi:hypothetical protein